MDICLWTDNQERMCGEEFFIMDDTYQEIGSLGSNKMIISEEKTEVCVVEIKPLFGVAMYSLSA